MIESVRWNKHHFEILDQTLLPHQEEYRSLKNIDHVIEAIQKLRLRGAPLIGVVAAIAMAEYMLKYRPDEQSTLDEYFYNGIEKLKNSRPTAKNLFYALDEIKNTYEKYHQHPLSNLIQEIQIKAKKIWEQDQSKCAMIAEHGAKILSQYSRILTHCNTGALATSGIGTALGVIVKSFELNPDIQVFVDETRPLNQGGRLTCWELSKCQIPYYLVADSMAGIILKDQVDCVIVGADRIALNGDSANKIGTYSLAIIAQYHQKPFYIAAPWTTFDLEIDSGDQIPIEFRNDQELLGFGPYTINYQNSPGFNPAFDVTPHHLITGIMTEYGVLYPPFSQSIHQLKKRFARD